MRPLPWIALSLALTGSLASSDAAGQVRELIPLRGGSAQVTIGTAAPELWKLVEVGLDSPPVMMKGDRGYTIRSAVVKPSRVTVRAVISGATSATFETDLAPGITRVAFEPMPFETGETRDATGKFMALAGIYKPSEVTFTATPPVRALADWAAARTPRNVTVTVKAGTTAARVITLRNALPRRYTYAGASSSLTITTESIATFAGPSHPAETQWFAGWLTGAGAFARRDVKVVFTDAAGLPVASTMLKESVLAEYGISALDRASTEPVSEWFTVQPSAIEPLP